MKKLLLLIPLLALFWHPVHAQAPAQVDCSTSVACNSSTGPSNTALGYPIWKGFGIENENWLGFPGCALAASTSGQICMSNGSSSQPTYQSATALSSLSAVTTIACADLIPEQPSTTLEKATACQLSLFVGTNSLSSGTSITPSCAAEDNFGSNTATGGTFTVNAPTGCTAAEGQILIIHIKFTNVQTYSWNAAFVGGTNALPTTSTGSSKGDWAAFRYDSINSKWDYLAVAPGF